MRIYFDGSTFDVITKDRAAKFVDIISAIGGTLGLFTGFSIMSAVEIVYFGIKILLEAIKAKLSKRKLAAENTEKIHFLIIFGIFFLHKLPLPP